MPPKAKFTEEEIVRAAFRIVRAHGMDALTARALGRELGSSACPIFTVFASMKEVQAAVEKAIRALYSAYVTSGLQETPAFKGVGQQYIRFSREEPVFFRILFMSETEGQTPETVLPAIEERYEEILSSVRTEYGLNRREAMELYRHLWIYTHGIATLCATRMCTFTEQESGELLTQVCRSILKEIIAGRQKGTE